VVKLARTFPGIEEGMSYGTPSLHVRTSFLARLKEDGVTVALRIPMQERDLLLELEPETFFITDHYRNYPAILIRLERVRMDVLADLLEKAWRWRAPKSLQAKSVAVSRSPARRPAGRARLPSAKPRARR
jgi:hypothetical protein